MKKAVVCCEGSHDHLGLAWALRHRGWQVRLAGSSDPDFGWALVSGGPLRSPAGEVDGRSLLVRGDSAIFLRSFNGIDALTSRPGEEFIANAVHQVDAIGVFLDADDTSVEARCSKVCAALGRVLGLTGALVAGGLVEGRVRVGLWVAPDNHREGTLDDLLVDGLRARRPTLARAAETFVQTPDFDPPAKGARQRAKALLGAAAQASHPGRSLAQALRETDRWLAGSGQVPSELDAAAAFLERLVGD